MKDVDDNRRRADKVEKRVTPRTPVIYEIVRRHGDEEMKRPAVSLWWSGLAAGMSISFSLYAQAVLDLNLPAMPGRELLVSLGYPVGFLMVVLSRQQLFTENTITVVLPVMARPGLRIIGRGARMWSIVLAANLSGTLLAALVSAFTPLVGHELWGSMLDVSRHAISLDPMANAFRGIVAGYLIAAMVWLMPAAGNMQFHVVGLMTYLVGVSGAPHIIAGSVEAFLLAASGELGIVPMLGHFLLPVLLGNMIGGTALFALISYAQVMKEL